jgi:hypothetical protein
VGKIRESKMSEENNKKRNFFKSKKYCLKNKNHKIKTRKSPAFKGQNK